MGLLNGGIAAIFSAAFSGLYLDGLVHKGTAEPVYDDEGNITGYSGPGDVAIKVQVDSATWSMRNSDGFADGDVRLIILAQGIGQLNTDQEVTVSGRGIYRLMSAELDAAASHWVCRGRVKGGE